MHDTAMEQLTSSVDWSGAPAVADLKVEPVADSILFLEKSLTSSPRHLIYDCLLDMCRTVSLNATFNYLQAKVLF